LRFQVIRLAPEDASHFGCIYLAAEWHFTLPRTFSARLQNVVPVLEVTGLTCDDMRAHATYARMVVGMNDRGMTCVYRALQLW
jgi:hypothetical protein